MNPFDEQEQQIEDTADAAIDELRRKKLFTWYDIESAKTTSIVHQDKETLWKILFGVVIGLFLALIISIIAHN